MPAAQRVDALDQLTLPVQPHMPLVALEENVCFTAPAQPVAGVPPTQVP
jgi:hypothetical protein